MATSKVKHLFKWGAVLNIGDGKTCEFWEDCWLHEVPLKILYEDLYKMVRNILTVLLISDCWSTEGWEVDFRRSLTPQEWQNWLGLVNELQTVTLVNSPDFVSWLLDKSKQYTTESLYRFLTDMGVSSRVSGILWKCKVSLKIKFFLWQVFNNKLQVAQCLVKRG
jgi:hypothetical protein